MESESLEDRLILLEDDMNELRKLPDRVTGLADQVTGLTGQMTGLTGQMTGLTGQVTGLTDRVGTLESNLLQFRGEVRDEFSTIRLELQGTVQMLRAELRAGDAETRRYMRVLHEEVLTRIASLRKG